MPFLITLNTFIAGCFKRSPKSAPEIPPPSVDWLLANRHFLRSQHALTPGENSLVSLYRMYEHIVNDYNLALRSEIEYSFNRPKWLVSEIPDPADPDPARYAILAVLPQFLVLAFNRLIERGLHRDAPAIFTNEDDELKSRPRILEEVPSWTAKVPALREMLVIPSIEGHEARIEQASPEFLEKNLVIFPPHVLFA
ncbi:hypothetical protein H2199_008565 [Coniosporium tulheliwenetii]|uniref:Uncharacterized protein n=1 Tax=Coniosporium tulheliwenetii TaxID=3383036 RepID=A0ACC2YIB0_9PEZI|nr:hypothetical protein H2199_008565 [Cladosporium sp. JES 115]